MKPLFSDEKIITLINEEPNFNFNNNNRTNRGIFQQKSGHRRTHGLFRKSLRL